MIVINSRPRHFPTVIIRIFFSLLFLSPAAEQWERSIDPVAMIRGTRRQIAEFIENWRVRQIIMEIEIIPRRKWRRDRRVRRSGESRARARDERNEGGRKWGWPDNPCPGNNITAGPIQPSIEISSSSGGECADPFTSRGKEESHTRAVCAHYRCIRNARIYRVSRKSLPTKINPWQFFYYIRLELIILIEYRIIIFVE